MRSRRLCDTQLQNAAMISRARRVIAGKPFVKVFLAAALVSQWLEPLWASPISVSMWVHSGPGPERQVYEESVQAFNHQHSDIHIELTSWAEGEYAGHTEAAARTHQLPCLLDFDGPNVDHYAAGGHLKALDDMPAARNVRSHLLRTVEQQGMWDGRLYSIGQYDSGLAIWGNRAVLERAGVRIPRTTAEAWNLTEFQDALAKLKAMGIQHPLDMKLNYTMQEWLTYSLLPIVQSFGGDVIEREHLQSAQGVINGDAAVQAMETVQSWVRSGYVNAATPADDDFIKGRAALSYVGHWAFRSYKAALGEKLVLIPMPRFGSRIVTGAGSWSWGISTDCRAPRAAALVLEHLLSKGEVLRVTAANGAVPSTLQAIAFSPYHVQGGPMKIYVDQILDGSAKLRPQTPEYPIITAAFSNAARNILDGAPVRLELDKAASAIDFGIAKDALARTQR